MIKLLIPILLLCFSTQLNAQEEASNQLDGKGRKTGHWISLDADGNKRYDGMFLEGHPIGLLTRYYPDGGIKAIMDYDSSGIEVDASIYDESGKVRANGKYVNQLKHGKWIFLSSTGIPILEVDYKDDKLNGTGTRFYANGNPMEITTWSDNILHGLQQIFDEQGEKSAEIFYRNNQMDGAYLIYHPGGNLAVKGTYSQDRKEGDWVYYLINGEVDYTLKYSKGKFLNPEILDQRRKDVFDSYEKNKTSIKDPRMYLSDPESYFRK